MRRLTLVTNPDKCNLRCPLCFLNQRGLPYGKGEMDLTTAVAAVEKFLCAEDGRARNFREVIPSTMGEPLLYLHFRELLEFCGGHGIPMNLTTNGTFPGFWGTDEGMTRLLAGCSDIKISCMAFDESMFAEMMPGSTFDRWLANVQKLLDVRASLNKNNALAGAGNVFSAGETNPPVSKISLQVTLHKKLVPFARHILDWSETVGIDRIKWNLPVFLEAGAHLKEKYAVDGGEIETLRSILHSEKVLCQGSLFFQRDTSGGTKSQKCIFEDEIWVMPDGSIEKCPNPEKRFGNHENEFAKCEKCLLFR